MIKSDVNRTKGYSHFTAADFVGVVNVEFNSSASLSIWPDGVNGSNEPDACAMLSIEEDWLDGEQPKDSNVLLNREACLKLRDMLNERFPNV